MRTKYAELESRLRDVHDLFTARSVLIWDQMTFMPVGGGAARARQLATIRRLAHEKLLAPDIGRLLDALEPWADSLERESPEASLIRAARREVDRATRVPGELLGAFQMHAAESYQAWLEARPRGDFAAVLPYLRKTLDFSRRISDCHPDRAHVADPLIDATDPGMTVSALRAVFAEMRAGLVPLARAIREQPVADDACLHGHFPQADQHAFGRRVSEALGFDFTRGRQDVSPHPFTVGFSLNDVRSTTRVDERHLASALFCTLHETGHALYEQGISAAYEGSFLAHVPAVGMHESQARLVENLVGRSRPFWEYWYERLAEAFPAQLRDVSMDTFHRAINKVDGSLIRVQADEVTYNLHIILRFDFELALLEGTLALEDLPEAWRARHLDDFGVAPTDHRDGVLQDVHWFRGLIGGAFHSYALGDLLAAQFFERAALDLPGLYADLRNGHADSLLGWLRRKVHAHGDSLTSTELIERATGDGLQVAPFLRYLRAKYRELYPI